MLSSSKVKIIKIALLPQVLGSKNLHKKIKLDTAIHLDTIALSTRVVLTKVTR